MPWEPIFLSFNFLEIICKQINVDTIHPTGINEKLLQKLEDKAKIVEKLEQDLLLERRKNNSGSISTEDRVVLENIPGVHPVSPNLSQRIGPSAASSNLPSVEEIRQMEVDLKRKSDLLSGILTV